MGQILVIQILTLHKIIPKRDTAMNEQSINFVIYGGKRDDWGIIPKVVKILKTRTLNKQAKK